MTKNAFQRYIICLCLKSFTKNHIFRDKLWKMSIKVCLILCIGPTGTRNQNPTPLLYWFLCHAFNGSHRISKWTSVENCIIQCKHYCLSLRKISISWYLSLYFWKLNILLDSYWQVGFNFNLKSLFFVDGRKIDILDDFAPRVRNMEL